ncbi:VCBS repeat-containing protein [Dyadobacter sp. CY261]|uniref:FG-GAP repeat domain-containing protein n=1 Tax=Dyadobacter sp. CY261 TaxID=2907203 RepID=UPI001F1C5D2C|nr:VCBS repeat-containing protein [Dyadobacter sp. CY261]MCF0074740.1 VCBS repeat-containing protein [Dyadobacter sp. CY261]
MNLLKWLSGLLVIGIFVAMVAVQSCGPAGGSGEKELTGELAAGRDAAKRYCSTCHLPVDPALLDKDTWKNQVLPAMAPYLGIEVWQKSQYFASEKSAMPIAEWMNIVAYYDSLAPASLSAAHSPAAVSPDWANFKLKTPASDTARLATTTMVAIDTASKAVFTSSSEVSSLIKWNNTFKKEEMALLPSPAIHVSFSGSPIVTAVGEMKAYDVSQGELYRLEPTGKPDAQPFITGLRRPLHTTEADFNRDGKTDYAVSAFGHALGGLYVFMQMDKGKFEKIPVREVAGATQSVTGDFNGDGWPDIIALFAHADEGIWLFTNNQKGGFSEKNLLRFPPVYGSSSFQLADFNRDGKPDILYTAGDNSDYSRILKPYHGIYIFLNQGNFQFEQNWFYPVNGATKAMAADFDRDGDPDIASVAFFADLHHNPAEKFLYFRNESPATSGLKFQPFSPPISGLGRWICMDVNDWDGDGDPDIVLGNYSKGFLNQEEVKADWNVYLPFLVLENANQ